jgi:hypothetical protein
MNNIEYSDHLISSVKKIINTNNKIDDITLKKYTDLLELFGFNLNEPNDVITYSKNNFEITNYGKQILAKNFQDNLSLLKIIGVLFLLLAAFINHEVDFCKMGELDKGNPYITMYKTLSGVMPFIMVYIIIAGIQEPDNIIWRLLLGGVLAVFISGLILLVPKITTNQRNFIGECVVAGIGGLAPYILMYSIRMHHNQRSWTGTTNMIKTFCILISVMYGINWVLQFSGFYSFTMGETKQVTYKRLSAKSERKYRNSDIVLVPQDTLAQRYQKGWLIAGCAIVALAILYYCYSMGIHVYDTPDYYTNSTFSKNILFIAEIILFATGNAATYLYAVNNRQGKITSKTWEDVGLIFGKFSILHIVMQYTGFYGSLGL